MKKSITCDRNRQLGNKNDAHFTLLLVNVKYENAHKN